MITGVKTVLSAAIASLGLLTLAASPTFANTHIETKIPATASIPTEDAKLAQQQSQTPAQTNQKAPQPNQMGCSCCQNMMNNNMKGMTNMPGMMGNPSQSR